MSGEQSPLPDPKPRLDRATLDWMQIPEQAWCVCGHEKAVHTSGEMRPEKVSDHRCSSPGVCGCIGFLGRDERIGWDAFRDRIIPHPREEAQIRGALRGALRTAFLRSGFDVHAIVQPWDTWMATARRAWKAWQDAGRPMRFAKRVVFHRPVSIPELES